MDKVIKPSNHIDMPPPFIDETRWTSKPSNHVRQFTRELLKYIILVCNPVWRVVQHILYDYIYKLFCGIIEYLKFNNHCNHEVSDIAFCD
jgi:hypothetical protein